MWRRHDTAALAALVVAAAGAATLLVRGAGGQPVPGFDTTYAAVWGRDLVHGAPLATPAGAPTPHPLGLLLGVAAQTGGDHARTVLALLGTAGYVATIILAALAAARLSSRRSAWTTAGAAAMVAVLMSRPQLVYLARAGSMDWVYAALAMAALWLALNRRWTPAATLAAAAALHRPEAWLFAAALLALGWRDIDRRATRATACSALAATPLAWLGTGLLFGSPLAALRASQQNATSFGRDTGLGHAIVSFPQNIAVILGWTAFALGALSLCYLAAIGRRQAGLRVLIAALVAASAGPLVAGAAGAAVLARYHLLTGILIATAAVATVTDLWGRAGWRRVTGAAVGVGIAALAVTGAPRFTDLAATEQGQRGIEGALVEALTGTSSDCGQVYVPVLGHIPLTALILRRPLIDVSDLPPLPPASGTVLHPLTLDAVADYGYAPPQDPEAALRLPPDFSLTATSDTFSVYSTCK